MGDTASRDTYVRTVFGVDPAVFAAAVNPGPAPAAAKPPADAPLAAPPPLVPLSPARLEEIANAKDGASRDQVERELASFLQALQQDQGGRSGVRVTDKVRMAGHALAEGMRDADLAISAMLADDRFGYAASELAHKIAAALPANIPQANFQKFLALKPKEVAAPASLSFAGAVAKLITPDVKKLVGFLPEKMQKAVIDGVQKAIEKGLVAIADQAMAGSSLDAKAKEAIHTAVEAAIKENGVRPTE